MPSASVWWDHSATGTVAGLPMRVLGGSGVWELFVPGLEIGSIYKYEVRSRVTGGVELKTDPYTFAMEMRPATAAIVTDQAAYHWQDDEWMQARRSRDWLHAPLSIYEVHLGSWQRHADGQFLSYRELTDQLLPYVKKLGFTHIELLPVTEHPLDDSWGYQTTGYFAPTSRFGPADDLKYFIDRCHQEGIGVLLDWVPAHFRAMRMAWRVSMARPCMSMRTRARGSTRTGAPTSSTTNATRCAASCWPAPATGWRITTSMGCASTPWHRCFTWTSVAARISCPTSMAGARNIEAIDFLRTLNSVTHARSPGTVIMAEESTDWPLVSRPVDTGGLGFSMKWNMGWMHDTLGYFKQDPLWRKHHQDSLTFAMMYAYTENFILPLSHDEVVHLKRSLLGRMPGDRWQQLANLRLMFTYMWTLPGKKLLFMGGEFAHPWEWGFPRRPALVPARA